MSDREQTDVAARLLAHRHVFKSFVASRVGNEADAEDILQNGLVKALNRAGELKQEEKAIAWFYQILRNVIVDHVRSRGSTVEREKAWANDSVALADDEEAARHICACFEKMLPAMKPHHAELIRRVELHGESVASVGQALGMTANNASVTLHRARADLRTRLVDFCGECSCLDNCECE